MKKLIIFILTALSLATLSAQNIRPRSEVTMPEHVKDTSLTANYLFYQVLTRHDSVLLGISRKAVGDTLKVVLRARSLGRSERIIQAGLEAWSNKEDTILASVHAGADGVVRIDGTHGIIFGPTGIGTGYTNGPMQPDSNLWSKKWWVLHLFDSPFSTLTMSGSATIKIKGITSGTVTFVAPTYITDYSMIWPAAQASGTQYLKNSSGTLSWDTPSVGGDAYRSDSTLAYGPATRTMLQKDSLYRAAQDVAIRAVQAADSTYKTTQIALKLPSSSYTKQHIIDSLNAASPWKGEFTRSWLFDSTIVVGGNVNHNGIIEGYSAPTNLGTTALMGRLYANQTLDGTYYNTGNQGYVNTVIASGKTNSGYSRAQHTFVVRNYTTTSDNGTLAAAYGQMIQYGHYNSDAGATPTTTTVIGLQLNPLAMTGTITNLYDLYIAATLTGGTVGTHWGIYQADAAANYLKGALTLGGNLTVNGTGTNAFAGKIGVTSTAEQIRAGYDATNYTSFTVNATGVLAITSTSTGAKVNIPSLPTSSAGLATGDLWVDTTGGLNILKVK